MSQSQSEIAKEIVIAAIQAGYIAKQTTPNKSHEEASRINADNISAFYKTVYKAVLNQNN